MNAAGWQPATIERITVQTPTVTSFVLRPKRAVRFRPGQHVDVRLTAPDGYTAVRAYSICSSPADTETVELAIERLSDGEVSPYFHEVAQAGDSVEIRGPFTSHFIWDAQSAGTTLLIGGGSGVAPLMSMIRARAAMTAPPALVLVYSARGWSDVIFREELLLHERTRSALRLVLVLTRSTAASDASPPVRAADYTRRVDQLMLQDVLTGMPEAPRAVLVCGNNGFVSAVADALVHCGIAPDRIRTERYGE